MKEVTLGIFAFALFAVLVVPVVAQVYFVPQSSSAKCGDTTEVAVWVKATKFQSGQININHDPRCTNVTTWERNITNFPMGIWEHYDGNDRIGFVGTDLKTGEYMIGMLTIHCVDDSGEGCETPLDFDEDSKLVDDYSNPITAKWVNGLFKCIYTAALTTPTPTSSPTPLLTPTPTTPTPEPSLNPLVVETPIPTPKPEQTLTTPVTTTSPTPTASSPTHSPTPTTGGFEAVFAIIVLALSYLSLKSSRGKN